MVLPSQAITILASWYVTYVSNLSIRIRCVRLIHFWCNNSAAPTCSLRCWALAIYQKRQRSRRGIPHDNTSVSTSTTVWISFMSAGGMFQKLSSRTCVVWGTSHGIMIGMYQYFFSEFQLGDIREAFPYQTESSMNVVAINESISRMILKVW